MPSPAPPPPTVDDIPVASLPANERAWDGHRWRRLPKDHVHGEGCGHTFRLLFGSTNRGWALYTRNAQLLTGDVSAEDRKDPDKGIYSYDGRLYSLADHKHGDGCGHTKTADGWEEPLTDSR